VLPQTAATVGLMHDVGRSVVHLFIEKHPEISPFAGILDTAQIGANLVRQWGLPERICRSIEYQNRAQFMLPDSIDGECRKEVAVLYLAHIFEGMLTGVPVEDSRQAFFSDFCEVLKISPSRAQEICMSKILPNLAKSRHRLPPEVRSLLSPDAQAEVKGSK
jgi:hypothetical protein